MRRILVIGCGIAGVETALTLARGLPEDRVVLLGHTDVLRVVPDLVYVPTGVSAQRLELPLGELLAGTGVELVLGEVERVDVTAGVAIADTGEQHFDVLVAAPGAAPMPTSGMQIHRIDEAIAVRDRLDQIVGDAAERRLRSSICIRAAADDAWSPPAYELAALLAMRRRSLELERLVSITLVTAEMAPFQWFEPHVADIVTDNLVSLGVELATGVPEARFDDLAGDLVIDFGQLQARHLPGLPGRALEGWYETDASSRVHERAFVVGDASSHGFKAAFAAAWEARRVLLALGGDLDRLGRHVAGVPVDSVEHHVELGMRTLRVRLPITAKLRDPWLGHQADTHIDDEPPDRLAGMLLGDALRTVRGSSAAQAHRALVTRRESRRLPGARARIASRPTP